VSEGVGEGVVVSHQRAQGGGVRGVDRGDEGEGSFEGSHGLSGKAMNAMYAMLKRNGRNVSGDGF
jgi:hypothetical protein